MVPSGHSGELMRVIAPGVRPKNVSVLVGRDGRFEKCFGEGTKLHGLRNLVIGRVADVYALQHWRVRGKALGGIEDGQGRPAAQIRSRLDMSAHWID